MAIGIFMPKLSMAMETGTIIQWFKKVGDDVKEGDVLLEVLTDKINIEVEAYATGKLLKVYYEADQVVPVQQIIGYIGTEGEAVPDCMPNEERSPSPYKADASPSVQEDLVSSIDERKLRATPAARKAAQEKGLLLQQIKGSGPNGRIHKIDVETYSPQQGVKATPLARKIAQVEGLPLETIAGTGSQGKVCKDDVLHCLQGNNSQPPTQPIQSSRRVKLEGIRKVISQRMTQSAFSAPHVTLVTEADMSASIDMRKSLLPIIEKRTGLRLSYTEVIMKAVSHALTLHPQVNASLQDDEIIFQSEVNIGLAVSIPGGLVVPVIKQTERKGLAELTVDCKKLAGFARESKLLPDQLTGGTFTISNLGMYAIDAFTPIINSPESAILGVGRILEKPVGIEGKIELRPMITLSLSFDHRVLDGAPAAAFLQSVKEILENPYQLIV